MTGCCVHVTEQTVQNKVVATSLKMYRHFVVGLSWLTGRARWRQPVARIFNDAALFGGGGRERETGTRKEINLGWKTCTDLELSLAYSSLQSESTGEPTTCVCVCAFVCVCVFSVTINTDVRMCNRNTDIVRHCLVEHLETGIGQVTSFRGIARQPQHFYSKKITNNLSRGCFASQRTQSYLQAYFGYVC
jgi:hypothetical protein